MPLGPRRAASARSPLVPGALRAGGRPCQARPWRPSAEPGCSAPSGPAWHALGAHLFLVAKARDPGPATAVASAQTALPLLKGCYKKTQRDCRPGTDAGAPRPVRARVPRPWLRAPRPGVVAPGPGRAAGVTLWACLHLSSDNVPNAVWIWDVQKLRLFVVLEQLSPVRAFQWDPQRPRLAICTGSSKVYLWSRAGCVSVQVPGEGEHGAPHTGDRGGSSARPPDILSTRLTGRRPHALWAGRPAASRWLRALAGPL